MQPAGYLIGHPLAMAETVRHSFRLRYGTALQTISYYSVQTEDRDPCVMPKV